MFNTKVHSFHLLKQHKSQVIQCTTQKVLRSTKQSNLFNHFAQTKQVIRFNQRAQTTQKTFNDQHKSPFNQFDQPTQKSSRF
jgi:hypothetical protein